VVLFAVVGCVPGGGFFVWLLLSFFVRSVLQERPSNQKNE
jgi:hypothetical protein